MDPVALFDATRGWWRVSPRTAGRLGVRHAVPVVEGVTRGLYEITEWLDPRADGRCAFNGRIIRRGKLYDAFVGTWGRQAPFVMGAGAIP